MNSSLFLYTNPTLSGPDVTAEPSNAAPPVIQNDSSSESTSETSAAPEFTHVVKDPLTYETHPIPLAETQPETVLSYISQSFKHLGALIDVRA